MVQTRFPGKINRLLQVAKIQDWDDFVPDLVQVWSGNHILFTFAEEATRLGFPHIRIRIQGYCCEENPTRLEQCSGEGFCSAVFLISVDFGRKSNKNSIRQWVQATPGNSAIIDHLFDFIELPGRYTRDDCGNVLDTRSDWVDFWAMLNRWVDLAKKVEVEDPTKPPELHFAFLLADSLVEPPRLCLKSVPVLDPLYKPWEK